jgi:hypothetical protein
MGMLETYIAQVSKDSRLEESNERCGGYRVCNHSDCLVVKLVVGGDICTDDGQDGNRSRTLCEPPGAAEASMLPQNRFLEHDSLACQYFCTRVNVIFSARLHHL